ncbi:MAG TPA: DUF971 domain-containing protein [Verrucomicrobiaceae bacterium]|jgi:DUF971 family protein
MTRPTHLAAIGNEIAIAWDDGTESFIAMDRLRAHSPSAENIGETDLLGVQHGGTDRKDFSGVTVRGWNIVGGYAVQFEFSDGHKTGIYTFDYLKGLG